MVKSDGKGNQPNKSSHLTREEEEQMYTTGQFGFETLEALQRTMWWHTTVLFGHRVRQESRQMCCGDIALKQDDRGEEYLEFHERLTKARSSGYWIPLRQSFLHPEGLEERRQSCALSC